MKKRSFFQFIKATILAFVISFLCLGILAFVLTKWELSDFVLRGCILFIYVVSCFVAGKGINSHHDSKRVLWGGVMGAIYFAVILAISFWFGVELGTTLVSALAICVFSGMLSGVSFRQ